MNVYLDTSAIVPLVIHEVTSARATLLWERADRCASSVLADVETQAALAQARRQGRLTMTNWPWPDVSWTSCSDRWSCST